MSGRWAFASGCQHCHWLYGSCIEDLAVFLGSRTVLFSPAEIEIEDTWSVSGLCGTGSHHFRADNVLVTADRTFLTLSDPPCVDEPLVRIPRHRCTPSRSPASRSASLRGPGGYPRPRRQQGATARPHPLTANPYSSTSSGRRTRSCEQPAPCCTPTPRRRGRRRWPARFSHPPSGPGSVRRPRGLPLPRRRSSTRPTARGRHLALLRQPSPAPLPRHPRPDSTFSGQARHVHHGRCRARGRGRRPDGVLIESALL